MPVVVNEVEVLDTPPPAALAAPARPDPAPEPLVERLRCAQRELADRCRRLRAD